MADTHCSPWSDSVRFNKLGGAYQNGKPLPKWLRREIIGLAQSGVRQCEISHRLRITHGCVSKILLNYERTGHFEARRERVAGLRIFTAPRALRTDEYMQEQSRLLWLETGRDALCEENWCREEALQSPSSIRRNFLQTGNVGQMRTCQEQGDSRRSPEINNILNLPSKDQPIPTNKQSHPLQQSESFRPAAVSRDLWEDAHCPLPIRRRERIKYTSQQIALLEAAFQKSNYLTPSIEKQLARDTGVITSKIQVWFSNRRAKERKKALEAFCADSNTQSPQGGIANCYQDFTVPSPLSVVGPSRIYFPSRSGVNK